MACVVLILSPFLYVIALQTLMQTHPERPRKWPCHMLSLTEGLGKSVSTQIDITLTLITDKSTKNIARFSI